MSSCLRLLCAEAAVEFTPQTSHHCLVSTDFQPPPPAAPQGRFTLVTKFSLIIWGQNTSHIICHKETLSLCYSLVSPYWNYVVPFHHLDLVMNTQTHTRSGGQYLTHGPYNTHCRSRDGTTNLPTSWLFNTLTNVLNRINIFGRTLFSPMKLLM